MAYTFDPDRARAMLGRARGATATLDRQVRAAAPVEEKVAMAVTLYEAMKATRPDRPTDADRMADLAHHVEVRRLLRVLDEARPLMR